MKALVFGAGGMLGRALVAELEQRREPWKVVAIPHGEVDISEWMRVFETVREHRPIDRIFNVAGVLNTSNDAIGMVQTNALGPHIIAAAAAVYDIPLIHVSTDCVFSGHSDRWEPKRAGYTTVHAPAPVDLYGRTKLVGEVDVPLVTVVRTSFVGPDHGLWPWLIEQADNGAKIEGWTRARWSGSTVWAVAQALVSIPPRAGLIHLATEEPISKYEALETLAESLDLDIEIVENAHVFVDRALYPTHVLPSFNDALQKRPR